MSAIETNRGGASCLREPGRTVLLVEDDDAVRRSLMLLLRSHGYGVRAYASATGLAQDTEALRCDCLVADLMMPQISAIQLLEQMRVAGWAGRAILISGFLDSAWESKAALAGFDRVLAKPLRETVLVRVVGELFN